MSVVIRHALIGNAVRMRRCAFVHGRSTNPLRRRQRLDDDRLNRRGGNAVNGLRSPRATASPRRRCNSDNARPVSSRSSASCVRLCRRIACRAAEPRIWRDRRGGSDVAKRAAPGPVERSAVDDRRVFARPGSPSWSDLAEILPVPQEMGERPIGEINAADFAAGRQRPLAGADVSFAAASASGRRTERAR